MSKIADGVVAARNKKYGQLFADCLSPNRLIADIVQLNKIVHTAGGKGKSAVTVFAELFDLVSVRCQPVVGIVLFKFIIIL